MADINEDIIIFDTEDGGELRAQFIDSLFFNGDEYAILATLPEGVSSLEELGEDEQEIFFMKIVPADDDNVEYLPIDDDDLSDQLFEIVNQAWEDEDEADADEE